jgi:hypothetical protein
VTGDHQWIHVDVVRAKDTPFGGTIAHGYYTLSLAPMFTEQVMSLEEIPGGAQITLELTFEVEGGEKPACVAQTLARVYTG